MVVENLILTRSTDDVEQKYFYKLTTKSYKNVQAFGIEVDREDSRDGDIIKKESDLVELVSTNKEKVRSLLDILYRNQVSPIHLVEIIGEYVDKYVSDFDEALVLDYKAN